MRSRSIKVALVTVVLAVGSVPLAVMAAHNFTDVPDNHVFHSDIAWLAEADVTRGCNPPANTLFCPEDNVTRGQMAAFLNRLAHNRVVDAATAETAGHADTADTAGDADTLDGLDSTAFDTFVVAGAYEGSVDVTEPATLASVEFAVPVDATMALTGTASFEYIEDLVDFDLWAQLDNPECDYGQWLPAAWALATSSVDEPLFNSNSFTTGATVSAGSHTLTLCGDGDSTVLQAGITAVVSPSANSVVDVVQDLPTLSAPADRGTR